MPELITWALVLVSAFVPLIIVLSIIFAGIFFILGFIGNTLKRRDQKSKGLTRSRKIRISLIVLGIAVYPTIVVFSLLPKIIGYIKPVVGQRESIPIITTVD
jgi:hypothetical protein